MSRISLFCVGFLSLVSFGFAEESKQELALASEEIAVQEITPAVAEEVVVQEKTPALAEEIAQKEIAPEAVQEVRDLNTSSSDDAVEEPLQAKLFGF